MNLQIRKFAEKVLEGRLLDLQEIQQLSEAGSECIHDMLYYANRIRQKHFGNKVRVCSIVPGRLGGCDQDCAFCAQSIRYDTTLDKKAKTLTDRQILDAAREARDSGVPNFGIVYSGKSITERELQRLEVLAAQIRDKYGLGVCASLGIVNARQAKRLADAGLTRYNHNLETSERHFKDIVTTHKYSDRIDTIKTVTDAGFSVCAGGIFGIGENTQDRIDMALELRSLGVDTVPMNFLHPIEGTPMGQNVPLKPMEILGIIALYRFILPGTTLKVAGGRVLNLRDMQSWIFYAGCNSILTGNYLTTAGRSVAEDMQMLADLGLEPLRE